MPTVTYEMITNTTLGSNQSSIDLTSIPQTYTDLRVVLRTQTSTQSGVTYRYNGNTGSIYSSKYCGTLGSSITPAAAAAATSAKAVGSVGTGVGAAPTWALTTLDIMSYANTSFQKTTLQTDSNAANGSTEGQVLFWSMLFASTAAISSITFIGSFATGTSVSLYGIKAE